MTVIKNMAYWKAKNGLSSPAKQTKKKGKVTKEDSPGKWFQFIPMALSALGSMKKDKE